ncbi:MAG: COG1361 S-layer family protein [Methanohalophilus sp.]
MSRTQYNINNFRRQLVFLSLISVILLATLFIGVTTAQSKEYIPPTYEYTTNYYRGYGVPDIHASVVGDTHFDRGETVTVNVILSNRGILHGFKSLTDVEGDKGEQTLAMKELEYEKNRTTAYGIKASLVSPTDYIEINSSTSGQTLEKLVPGELPSHPMSFTIEISDDAPAGDYVLFLPVSYEYQEDVRMTDGRTAQLGLPDVDHATYYNNSNETLQIPIHIEKAAKFEVVDVDGELVAGEENVIQVTYRNVGELTADDALARAVVMDPLSTDSSTALLGSLEPGEERTVSFNVDSDAMAVVKEYAIDSEIRYIDEDGDYAFSGNMKINVPMRSSDEWIGITQVSLLLTFLIMIYLVVDSIRKKKK